MNADIGFGICVGCAIGFIACLITGGISSTVTQNSVHEAAIAHGVGTYVEVRQGDITTRQFRWMSPDEDQQD